MATTSQHAAWVDLDEKNRTEEDILRPLTYASRWYWFFVFLLGGIFGWGLIAWAYQIKNGLGVTGQNGFVYWAIYETNFIFFIGISHAGTLISSVLRIANVEWRRPFTRLAEAVTVFSLPFGATCVIVHLGNPQRVFNVLKHPAITSPILWDVMCISTYLLSSCIYFYLAMIPDIALCRDRLTNASPFRRWLYRTLSLGWTGTERQWRILDKILAGMSVFLFALVVSVHTNVSFVWGMTLKPGWQTSIIGPYFVLGAIFSGVATVIVVAAAVRKFFRLERYLTDYHFDRIGGFLLALSCFWFYFTFVEHFMAFYWNMPHEMAVMRARVLGEFKWLFWFGMALGCFFLPLPLLALKRRSLPVLVITSIIINIGMWFERFLIVVPSNTRPLLPYGIGSYTPTWVELSIFAGWVAGFCWLLLLFVKFFPSLTVWEVLEGKGIHPVSARSETRPVAEISA